MIGFLRWRELFAGHWPGMDENALRSTITKIKANQTLGISWPTPAIREWNGALDNCVRNFLDRPGHLRGCRQPPRNIGSVHQVSEEHAGEPRIRLWRRRLAERSAKCSIFECYQRLDQRHAMARSDPCIDQEHSVWADCPHIGIKLSAARESDLAKRIVQICIGVTAQHVSRCGLSHRRMLSCLGCPNNPWFAGSEGPRMIAPSYGSRPSAPSSANGLRRATGASDGLLQPR